jgi:hypothetical protein
MANKRFHFGANSVTKLIESGWNIVSFTYQTKVRAGFKTLCETSTFGKGTNANELIDRCVREIVSHCMRTGGITDSVGMTSLSLKEDKPPHITNFPLFAIHKKGHLTAIPKDVATALVDRVESDENLKRMVTSKILNYNEIKGSVVMNELSLSEYLDQRRAE